MKKYEWCKEIKRVLQGTSYDRPVTVDEITERIGMFDERRTRRYILETMKLYNFPIGSDGRGYFRIRTAQEMQRYLNALLKRQIAISERIDVCYDAFHGRFPV